MGRGRLEAAISAAAIIAAIFTAAAAAYPYEETEPVGEVAIFYYPWYGTPAQDGGWQHWTQREQEPPAGIASAFYPSRGAYSSSDAAVVGAQMREIAETGIRTVIVSWWGPESPEATRLPLVMRLARAAGLGVAVHIEPYGGRTPETVARDAQSLRALGITDVYVYGSSAFPDEEWAIANARARGTRLFANTSLPGKAKAAGFAGLYTYDVYVYDGSSFPRMCDSARRLGLLCAPSVGPGYDARRATGDQRVKARRRGATYDRMWGGVVRARADIVTITSYNEWHEGTQIEPARPAVGPYQGYAGAWGRIGRAAQHVYLDRTAAWVREYGARMSQTCCPDVTILRQTPPGKTEPASAPPVKPSTPTVPAGVVTAADAVVAFEASS